MGAKGIARAATPNNKGLPGVARGEALVVLGASRPVSRVLDGPDLAART